MKASFFIISFGILLLLSSCSKSEIEKDYYEINLNDTIKPNKYDGNATSYGYFGLSLDNDKVIDLKIIVQNYSLGREVNLSTKIELYNDFEIVSKQYEQIFTSSYDDSHNETSISYINMPKIQQIGDTITNQLNYLNDTLLLSYYNRNKYQLSESHIVIDSWLNAGNKYICLRNLKKNIFCWILLDAVDYDEIIIEKYAYAINRDFLIIK